MPNGVQEKFNNGGKGVEKSITTRVKVDIKNFQGIHCFFRVKILSTIILKHRKDFNLKEAFLLFKAANAHLFLLI